MKIYLFADADKNNLIRKPGELDTTLFLAP
jgi:hypothetical protein